MSGWLQGREEGGEAISPHAMHPLADSPSFPFLSRAAGLARLIQASWSELALGFGSSAPPRQAAVLRAKA